MLTMFIVEKNTNKRLKKERMNSFPPEHPFPVAGDVVTIDGNNYCVDEREIDYDYSNIVLRVTKTKDGRKRNYGE